MTIDPVELERLIEIAGKMPISSYPGKSYDERSRNAVTMVDTLIDLRKSLRTGQLVPAQPSNRIIYNLQKGGDRLCDALRTIAAGCDDPKGVAKAALNHKAPWLEPPAMPSGDVVEAVADHNLEHLEMSEKLQDAEDEIRLLAKALHDAINSPKGVVPASAEAFYDPAAIAALDTHRGKP